MDIKVVPYRWACSINGVYTKFSDVEPVEYDEGSLIVLYKLKS